MKSIILSVLMTLGFAAAAAEVAPEAFPNLGRACFFADVNYSGQSFCIEGAQNVRNLIPSGWNDQISSVRIEGFATATLYRNTGYRGAHLTLTRSDADLRNNRGWNDATSSIKTKIRISFPIPVPTPPTAPRGQVCFYENVGFSGAKACVTTGHRVNNLIPSGWNDRISSIAVGRNARAIVYENINLGGAHLRVNSSISDLRRSGWNDRISSLRVR